MSQVRQEIQRLAADFTESVVSKLRHLLVEEFLGESKRGRPKAHLNGDANGTSSRTGKAGRLKRSAEDIQALTDQIVELVSERKEGMRGEEIRQVLGIDRREWNKPLKNALAEGRLSKTGEKRATVYTVTGKGGAGKSTKPAIKKAKGKTKKAAKKTAKKKTKSAPARKMKAERSDSMPPSPLEEDETETNGGDEDESEDES